MVLMKCFAIRRGVLKKGCEFIWATNLAFAVIYICSLNKQRFLFLFKALSINQKRTFTRTKEQCVNIFEKIRDSVNLCMALFPIATFFGY